MSGAITASEPSRIAPFTGLSARQFGKLVTTLRQLTPLLGVSQSAADRIVDQLGPLPAAAQAIPQKEPC